MCEYVKFTAKKSKTVSPNMHVLMRDEKEGRKKQAMHTRQTIYSIYTKHVIMDTHVNVHIIIII